MNKNHLEDLFFKWDLKHTDFLQNIYAEYIDNPLFIKIVIEIFLTNTDLEIHTSWLIKNYYDQGNTLNYTNLKSVLCNFKNLSQWAGKLHMLQLLPKIQLTNEIAEKIEPLVYKELKSKYKFVKAAAFEAYYEIVKLYPDLKQEFEMLCKLALEKESASVKVKIRKIINQA